MLTTAAAGSGDAATPSLVRLFFSGSFLLSQRKCCVVICLYCNVRGLLGGGVVASNLKMISSAESVLYNDATNFA